MILGIAGVGIIFILFGAIAVLIRKKPKQKAKPEIGAVHPALEETESSDLLTEAESTANEVMAAVESESVVEFVSRWEDLPEGEWLPNDENGVNWYQDNEGRYWYSTDGGFKIWKQ